MSEIVLGAGPAGLGVAYRLARAGHEVTVFERADVVGGLAASFEVAGVRVDHGSHRLHPTTPPAIMATVGSLLGADLQRRRRNGRVRLAGRFVAFPPRPLDLVRRLPPPLAARLARDLATGPCRRARADTFAEVVRASLGPTLHDRFSWPYVEKLFGVPPDELSGELARRRIGTRDARALVRRVVRPGPRRGFFCYPRRGYGQISEALADAAVAAGARIVTGAEVTALHAGSDGVDVAIMGGAAERAAHVWSTLPLPVLARIAGAPHDVADAARSLEARALTLVYLVLPVAQWTEFDAHYLPEPELPMVRVSEPKNYRDSRDDPCDATVLCAEVPGTVDDPVAAVLEGLERAGLRCPPPVGCEVRVVPRAYPVYRVGFERAFAVVDSWAGSLERVTTFGRQGLFAHDNAHHALAMAWAAADAYSGGSVDPHAWREARQGFLAHVVED